MASQFDIWFKMANFDETPRPRPRPLTESQIAQRLFCTVFWLYWPILKQNGQIPWGEFVHKLWKKRPWNQIWRQAMATPFDVESQKSTAFVQHHLLTVLSWFPNIGKKFHWIQNGQLWRHATVTPFDVESQIAQLFSSYILWVYWRILKPNGQMLWEEFVQIQRQKRRHYWIWPTLTARHGHALWRRVANSTTFLKFHLLNIQQKLEAQATTPLGGVRSNRRRKLKNDKLKLKYLTSGGL